MTTEARQTGLKADGALGEPGTPEPLDGGFCPAWRDSPVVSGLTSTESVYGFEFRSHFLKNESQPDQRILSAAAPGPTWWAPATVIVIIIVLVQSLAVTLTIFPPSVPAGNQAGHQGESPVPHLLLVSLSPASGASCF